MTERDISGNEDRADALGSAVPSRFIESLRFIEEGAERRRDGFDQLLASGVNSAQTGMHLEAARNGFRHIRDAVAALSRQMGAAKVGVHTETAPGLMRAVEIAEEYRSAAGPAASTVVGHLILALKEEAAALSTRAVRPGPSFPQSSPEAGGDSITPSKER